MNEPLAIIIFIVFSSVVAILWVGSHDVATGAITPGRLGQFILYAAFATHVVSPATMTVPYDPLGDFEPIALIGNTPWLFAVKNDLPVKNLPELIAWLKANPDKATFGTAGQGSPSHIGGVLFQNVTGTRFQFIPYRGTAPVVPDLVSGQIDMAILDPITSLPQHRAGKIRIIAVMGKKHGSGSQDIPLTDESGAPGVVLLFQLPDHHAQARVAVEEVPVVGDEGPEERVPVGAPVAAPEVAHLEEVIRAADVGLGGDEAAVGVHDHAVRIRQLDPFVGVGVNREVPFLDLARVHARQQGEIARHRGGARHQGVAPEVGRHRPARWHGDRLGSSGR